MKVKISVCRKVGLPNYGSAGASVEVEIDCPEKSPSENPVAVAAEVRRAMEFCEAMVTEQLASAAVSAAMTAPADRPPPSGPGRPPVGRPDRPARPADGRDRDRDRRTPARNDDADDHGGRPPRSGRELYAWARKQEEAGADGLIRHLGKWAARTARVQDPVVKWDAELACDGYAEALRFMEDMAHA